MSTIIAGGFDHVTQAEAACARLEQAGISPEFLCKFRVNPAGEHHALPGGGDHDESQGAEHEHGGAMKGAAIGGAVGLAAGVVAVPLLGAAAGIVAGIAAGAYTGALVGGLKRIDHDAQPGHTDVRPAETLLAVNIEAAGCPEDEVIRILEECGAQQVERADGTWVDGEWADFDPTTAPMVIAGPQRDEPRPTAGA